MDAIEQIVANVKELEERFLEKEIDTGDPADDVDPGPMGDGDDYDEFEAATTVAANSATNCMVAVEQLLRRGNKEKLKKVFGEDAEDLLRQTQECLQGIADMFDSDEEDDEEEEDPSEEKPKEEKPEKEKKPEKEEKPKDKPEEK